MKSSKFVIATLFLLIPAAAWSQSKSFQALKDNFHDRHDVHCVQISGFLCRSLLWIAGEWEFREAIENVSSIRVINIPKEYFNEELSVNGFKKHLKKDKFVELAKLKDHGDNVEIYLQQKSNKKDRYLVWIEELRQVTVVELKGQIDINKLKEKNQELSYNDRQAYNPK